MLLLAAGKKILLGLTIVLCAFILVGCWIFENKKSEKNIEDIKDDKKEE